MREKVIKLLMLCTSLVLITPCSQAMGYDYNYNIFIGGDLQRALFSGKDYRRVELYGSNGPVSSYFGSVAINKGQLQNYGDGLTAIAGFNLYNIGFEFGYTKFYKVVYPSYFGPTGDNYSEFFAEQRGNNIFLDLNYYWQINQTHVIKFIAGIGALKTYMRFSLISQDANTSQANFIYQIKNTRGGARIGLGWQFNLSHSWSTDITYKYQFGNAMYEDMQLFAIGLKYYFL